MEKIAIYTEKQRISKIRKEKKRLREIFKNMDGRKLDLVESLINDAAFQRVTLEETRELISKSGITEEYQNGANQKGIKKSSAVEVYDKMVNTYSKIIKQLCDLLPEQTVLVDNEEEQQESPADEILAFIARGRK